MTGFVTRSWCVGLATMALAFAPGCGDGTRVIATEECLFSAQSPCSADADCHRAACSGSELCYNPAFIDPFCTITNGGYGGTQFALSHGVPLVVAGVTEGKIDVCAHVAWAGAGINLKTETPTPAKILRATREVLANPAYRQRAQAIQADYAGHDGPAEAVALLEQLAATRRPVLRAA